MSQKELLTLTIYYFGIVVMMGYFWWLLDTKVDRVSKLLEDLTKEIEEMNTVTYGCTITNELLDEEIEEIDRVLHRANQRKE